jgi:hypothetical protein
VSDSTAELRTRQGHAQPLAELSRGLVHLFRQRAGRGPTEARAFWAGDDAVRVLLGGGYTVMAVAFLLEPLGGSGSAGRWGTGEEPVPPALTEDGAQPT